MTKVTIIGQELKEGRKLKPIEFTNVVNINKKSITPKSIPQYYENIELICRKYSQGKDLMFAYDRNREAGILYLGHFNDGIVE